jgi:hypothetical protein
MSCMPADRSEMKRRDPPTQCCWINRKEKKKGAHPSPVYLEMPSMQAWVMSSSINVGKVSEKEKGEKKETQRMLAIGEQ